MRLHINQLTRIGRLRAEEMQGATFAWRSREFPCTTTGFALNKDLRDAGFKQMSDGGIILRLELFHDQERPRENDVCRVRTSPAAGWLNLRIATATPTPHGEELHLSCVAA